MGTFTIVHSSLDDDVQRILDLVDGLSLEFMHFDNLADGQRVDTVIFLGREQPNLSDWLYWTNICQRDVFVSLGEEPVPSDYSDFYLPLNELCSTALARELISDILLGKVDPEYGGPRIVAVQQSIDSAFFANSKKEIFSFIKGGHCRRIAVREDMANEIKLAKDLPGQKFRNREDYDLARFIKNAESRFDKSLIKLRVDFTGSENKPSAPVLQNSASDLVRDARSSNLFVVLGVPGSGKSVQLQSIDEMFALEAIRSGEADSTLCFCVNLGEHASRDREIDPFAWLQKRWEHRFDETSMSFSEQLRTRRLVLLLDGFNEIPFADSEDRRGWMLRWKACIHDDLLSNPKVKVVVACRSRDNQISFGSEDTPATTATVTSLDRPSILDMARRTSFEGYLKLRAAFEEDASLEHLYRTPYTLYDFLAISRGPVPRTQSEVFWRRLASAVERERDISNPIIGGPWLPDDLVYDLLNADNPLSAVAALRSIPLFQSLGALAFWMTDAGLSGGQHRAAINLLEDFKGWLESSEVFVETIDRSQFRGLAENFSILIENEGYLKFSHQSLQDFFCVVGEPRQKIIDQATLESSSFEALLYPLNQALTSMVPGDFLQVVPSTGFEEPLARLVEVDSSAIGPAIQANPWLMAEIISKSETLQTEHLSRLVERLEADLDPQADVRVRLASLWALGLVNWKWPNPDKPIGPMTTSIERRAWRIGVTKAQAKRLNLSAHQRAKRKTVKGFSIGVFPVSNQEFGSFLEDGGYSNKDYWTPEGWRWRSGQESESTIFSRWIERRDRVSADRQKPVRLLREGKVSVVEAAAILRFMKMSNDEIGAYAKALVGNVVESPAFWRSPRYSNPLQPVVGVSFFEAEAYCKWLSGKIGKIYRLPSEAEWEAAALLSWTMRKEVDVAIGEIAQPDNWHENWGNSAEMHLGRPSPVGALSTGVHPIDKAPRDMCGNVFEWVTDAVNEEEDWCLVVKGGSFRHLLHRSHPGYRGRGDKTSRNDDNGFRIVT